MKRSFAPLALLLLISLFLVSCSDKTPVSGDGVLSSFTAEDLDGNAVDQSVFSGYRLTMVNIWATFCSPCIREMPDLGELNHEYAEEGFRIIGIPVDIANKEGVISPLKLNEALEIIRLTNADYLHLVPSASLYAAKIKNVRSVPETIFVDEYGNQVGESYIGARSKAEWAIIIETLLNEVG